MAPVPNLNWPTDLFAQANANTTAPLVGKNPASTRICPCGCAMQHNMAVSALEGEHGFRRVVWLHTMHCKVVYLRKQTGQDVT